MQSKEGAITNTSGNKNANSNKQERPSNAAYMNEKTKENIREIEKWVENQNFLPQKLGKNFIYTFLLGCRWDIEKTKKVLSNYFYARQSIPELFTKRDPLLKENITAWKYSCFVPLKGKQNNCRVFLGTSLNTENYDFVQFVKQMFMCFDLLIKNNEWGNGDRIVVLGYDKIQYQNVATYTMYITRKTIECERDNFLPGKLVAVHNVHIPPFMKKIHERFKPFLSPEDERLVQFHKTLSSLHKHVSRDILPLEYGGNAGPLKVFAENWYNVLKANRNFFLEEEKKRMCEARVTKGMSRQEGLMSSN